MLGSAFDADDAVQETMIRAWRAYDRFDGRCSLKSWLYRIATNVCLDELSRRGRRARPIEEGSPAPGAPPLDALTQQPDSYWIEPILDADIADTDAGPDEKASLRQSIRLAFVAALQKLPPKQRAALLMAEVLECPVAEVAETLDSSVASVNSALQRARSSLAKRSPDQPADLTPAQRTMVERYVAAFESYDVHGLVGLMKQEVTFCMPPYSLWLQGPLDVQTWMLGLGSGCRGSRLLPTFASGWPAFAQYRPNPAGGHTAWALIVLELAGDQIAAVNSFLDVNRLFPRFGFPVHLPPQ
ncbi:sigma-70 family RNA polymerase sigma factor [Occallatibacter riparius]|uniref:Sigma-70 family RNA polymerase sigma factor n=2 Tax=Occallatibacter riparius TaxID=1002689 RepID=A0A9J7BWP9_9BACT|nr:sigma-70 family RNA polymerase sigma factor [Occallatibacter riparius]